MFIILNQIKNFDGVENEYPLHFCHMVINHVFDNNLTEAKKYYDMAKGLLVDTKRGDRKVLPFYYYVPLDLIEIERVEQGTQKRLPSPEIENDSTHLWTQAMWFICELLGKFKIIIKKRIFDN
jgi:hypothetical protein